MSELYDLILICHGNVTQACEIVGINRRSLYAALKKNEPLSVEFYDILNTAIDGAEDEAKRRAVEGISKPVYFQGRIVGYERVYSDSLLARLLAAYRASWRKTAVDLEGSDGGPAVITLRVVYDDPRASGSKDG